MISAHHLLVLGWSLQTWTYVAYMGKHRLQDTPPYLLRETLSTLYLDGTYILWSSSLHLSFFAIRLNSFARARPNLYLSGLERSCCVLFESNFSFWTACKIRSWRSKKPSQENKWSASSLTGSEDPDRSLDNVSGPRGSAGLRESVKSTMAVQVNEMSEERLRFGLDGVVKSTGWSTREDKLKYLRMLRNNKDGTAYMFYAQPTVTNFPSMIPELADFSTAMVWRTKVSPKDWTNGIIKFPIELWYKYRISWRNGDSGFRLLLYPPLSRPLCAPHHLADYVLGRTMDDNNHYHYLLFRINLHGLE